MLKMWGGNSLRTVVLCSMAAVVCGSADVKAGMARPAASTTPQAVTDIEAATNADRSDADAGAASGARSKDSKALKQNAEGRRHAKPRSPAAGATPPGSLAPATGTFVAAGDAVANAEPAAAVTLPDDPSGLKVEGHIGLRLSNQSEYEGAKGRKTFAAPDFNITFNDRFFFSITDNMGLDIGADAKPQVGVYMVSTEALKVGLALTYESAFDKKVENSIYGARTRLSRRIYGYLRPTRSATARSRRAIPAFSADRRARNCRWAHFTCSNCVRISR
ncbi:hypothetical protein ACVIGA_007712 [Bradyrhizobium sp. USDA 3240]